MEPRFFRITVYCLLGVLGLSLGGFTSSPLLSEGVFLVFCALPALWEYTKKDVPLFSLLPKSPLSSLLFLPLLLGVTVGVSALTALLFPSLAPQAVPLSPLTVVTSALSPALGEELLFRFACLSLLLPYGKRFGVIVSALLFALFHQSFYQMPYALAAGIVLALAALYSRSLLAPIFLHFANNLLSLLIGNHLTPLLVVLFVGLGAASGCVLYILYRGKENTATTKAPFFPLSLLPLLLYAVYCILTAALRLR